MYIERLRGLRLRPHWFIVCSGERACIALSLRRRNLIRANYLVATVCTRCDCTNGLETNDNIFTQSPGNTEDTKPTKLQINRFSVARRRLRQLRVGRNYATIVVFGVF